MHTLYSLSLGVIFIDFRRLPLHWITTSLFKYSPISQPTLPIFSPSTQSLPQFVPPVTVTSWPQGLQHRADRGLQLGAQLLARTHAVCFRVGTVPSSGPGPPTTQLINRQRVEPERAGLAAPLPAVPSGLLGLGWCPQRLGQWD